MSRSFVIALCLVASAPPIFGIGASPVQAMNQEGHDDWMVDLPQAIALWEALPEARPLPVRRCPVTPEAAAQNPYEQIPLPRHRCPGRAGSASVKPLTGTAISAP
jgi:hypothetical protein